MYTEYDFGLLVYATLGTSRKEFRQQTNKGRIMLTSHGATRKGGIREYKLYEMFIDNNNSMYVQRA